MVSQDIVSLSAGLWYHRSLIPAIGRQRQAHICFRGSVMICFKATKTKPFPKKNGIRVMTLVNVAKTGARTRGSTSTRDCLLSGLLGTESETCTWMSKRRCLHTRGPLVIDSCLFLVLEGTFRAHSMSQPGYMEEVLDSAQDVVVDFGELRSEALPSLERGGC